MRTGTHKVSSIDLLVVPKHQGYKSGSLGYSADADISNDDFTNSTDYLWVAKHYGSSCTLPPGRRLRVDCTLIIA